MFSNKKGVLIASGISIAISLYQFFLLANLLERLARLLPGMKGMSSLFLIIAAGLGELAFIYTRFPHYQKRLAKNGLVHSFLLVTLAEAYLLAAFVPIRLLILARAFGIPMSVDVLKAGSATDTFIFGAGVVAAGICHAWLWLQRRDAVRGAPST